MSHWCLVALSHWLWGDEGGERSPQGTAGAPSASSVHGGGGLASASCPQASGDRVPGGILPGGSVEVGEVRRCLLLARRQSERLREEAWVDAKVKEAGRNTFAALGAGVIANFSAHAKMGSARVIISLFWVCRNRHSPG